ncbi:hypothetical protein ACIGEZ_30825 [Streptomyces sp. NPDC085481]|uniref:hypothetical protein n=1 Tax=Streptomyces sp. NPDC085481 TaxID=3365727 RepID=UPI0037D1CB8B
MKRTMSRAAVLAAAAGSLLVAVPASPAYAAPVAVDIQGGRVEWNANPYNGIPGDSFRVCDTVADGYGLETEMYKNVTETFDGDYVREVTTRGHDSPYCTPWSSGDLYEGNQVNLRTYKVKGTFRQLVHVLGARA